MTKLDKYEKERRRLRELGLHQYEDRIRRGKSKDEAIINAVAAIVAAVRFPEVVD